MQLQPSAVRLSIICINEGEIPLDVCPSCIFLTVLACMQFWQMCHITPTITKSIHTAAFKFSNLAKMTNSITLTNFKFFCDVKAKNQLFVWKTVRHIFYYPFKIGLRYNITNFQPGSQLFTYRCNILEYFVYYFIVNTVNTPI